MSFDESPRGAKSKTKSLMIARDAPRIFHTFLFCVNEGEVTFDNEGGCRCPGGINPCGP